MYPKKMTSTDESLRVVVEFCDPPGVKREKIMLKAAGMRNLRMLGDSYWCGSVSGDDTLRSLSKIKGLKISVDNGSDF